MQQSIKNYAQKFTNFVENISSICRKVSRELEFLKYNLFMKKYEGSATVCIGPSPLS